MISQKTIVSFLLALLLACSIKAYTLRLTSPCDAYLAGQNSAPATVIVNQQGRAYEVACDDWFLRQPRAVQALCLLDVTVLVVFGISAFADRQRRRELLSGY